MEEQTALTEDAMLRQAICMLCEGTGAARYGPNKGQRCPPCDGTGKMTEANHELAVRSWREHRRRRQVADSPERRDLM